MNWLLKLDNRNCYFALCLVSVLFAFLIKRFLYTDQLYYSTLAEQYTSEQIQIILGNLNAGWRQAIGYVFIPVIIIIRIFYTSFCLYIGNLVEEYHWKFKSLFNISLKADIVFCLSSACNFYYYALLENYKTIDDLGENCTSLLKIVGRESIPSWLILAFNSINVFELLYVALLVVMLKMSFHITYFKSIIFVLLTYCIGNYLYLVAMTFLYLNLS